MPSLSQIGEQEAIRRITAILGRPKIPSSAKIITGSGDDVAVVKLSTNARLLFTTDTLAEGTHFRLDWMRRHLSESEVWRSLGWKAMAVNLSDLAAMGHSRPLLALLTFGGHGDISVETVGNLANGISNISRQFGFSVLGGDTIRHDKTIISITLVGELLTNNPVLRSGAKIGDVLMCSGPLGLSMAGLEILKNRARFSASHERFLVHKHLYPVPRLKEAAVLGNVDNISTSMLDTSDDLASSMGILARQSRVGFECDLSSAVIHSALRRFCLDRKASPLSCILYGGEDYELLFTVSPGNVKKVLAKIPSSHILGRVLPSSQGIRITSGGRRLSLKDARFRHF